jgi:tetratricopeptide (TPR) repeat protein
MEKIPPACYAPRLEVFVSRLSVVLLSALLMAPIACEQKTELTAEELQARIAKKLEEADIRHRNNKVKDAEEIYKWILEQEANHAGALRGMSEIRYAEKNLEEAEKLANQAVAAGAAGADVYSVLGQVYDKTDRFAEAAEAWGKAYEAESTESRHGLKQGISLKNAKAYPQAEAVLRKVADQDAEVQFVYTELGDVLRETDRGEEALKLYMKAQTIFASDKRAHAGAAQVYEARGETTRAINEWSSYIRMDCCSDYSNDTAKPRLENLRQKEQGELGADTAPAEAAEGDGEQAG